MLRWEVRRAPGKGVERDGNFRLGPLPPGAYVLTANLFSGKGSFNQPSRRWRGAVRDVLVEVDKVTDNIAIPVGPLTNELR